MRNVEIHFNGEEDGDWVVIKVDGKIFYSGHSVSHAVLCDLLRHLGAHVTLNDEHTNDSIMDLVQ